MAFFKNWKMKKCLWSKRWFVVVSLIASSGSGLVFDGFHREKWSHNARQWVKTSDTGTISSEVKFKFDFRFWPRIWGIFQHLSQTGKSWPI